MESPQTGHGIEEGTRACSTLYLMLHLISVRKKCACDVSLTLPELESTIALSLAIDYIDRDRSDHAECPLTVSLITYLKPWDF